MIRVLCILLVLTLPALSVAENSRRESVETLLELSRADQMTETIYGQLEQMFTGMESQMGIQPEDAELFKEYMGDVMQLAKEEFGWAKMKEPMIEIYLKHFSEEEIQGMISFYRSDVGQSMLDKMPIVLQDSTAITQRGMQEFMPRVQAMAAELARKVRARRESAAASSEQNSD